MMRNLSVLLMLLLLFASCNKDEHNDSEYLANSLSFGISPASWETTRGADLTADSINSMSVFGYHTGDSAWNVVESALAAPSSVLFDCQSVTRASKTSSWTYAPEKSWLVYGKHHFFAFAPYGVASPIAVPAGSPSFSFNVNSSSLKQIDLLWSTGNTLNMTNALNGRNPILFNFKHALTKITFAAKVASTYSGPDVKIGLVQFQNLYSRGTAHFTYNIDTTAIVGGRWEVDTQSKDSDFSSQEESQGELGGLKADLWLNSSDYQVISNSKGAFYMLPQTAAQHADGALPTLILYFYFKDSPSIKRVIKQLTAPNNMWLPGQAIQYRITYNGEGSSPFQVEAVVVDWDTQDVDIELQGTYLHVSELSKTVLANSSNNILYYQTDYTGSVTATSSEPLITAVASNGVINVSAGAASAGTYDLKISAGGRLTRTVKIIVQ